MREKKREINLVNSVKPSPKAYAELRRVQSERKTPPDYKETPYADIIDEWWAAAKREELRAKARTKGPLIIEASVDKVETQKLPILNQEEAEWAKHLLGIIHQTFMELANATTRDHLPPGETSTDKLRKMAQFCREAEAAFENEGKRETVGERAEHRTGRTDKAAD